MSKIGKQPIEIPQEVQVKLDNDQVLISGPKGTQSLNLRPEIKVFLEGNKIYLKRVNETKMAKSLHGLFRTLIYNMVIGVTIGWEKTLEIVGTGFAAKMVDSKLVLNLGLSHAIEFLPPAEVQINVFENKIKITGANKAKVGEVAAKIRSKHKPETYTGYGIRYLGEVVKTRPGKVAKAIGAVK